MNENELEVPKELSVQELQNIFDEEIKINNQTESFVSIFKTFTFSSVVVGSIGIMYKIIKHLSIRDSYQMVVGIKLKFGTHVCVNNLHLTTSLPSFNFWA